MTTNPNPPDIAGLYPPGTTPEDRVSLSNYCSIGNRPLVVTGLLKQLLQQHFVNPTETVEDQFLRAKFRDSVPGWRADETTGIVIESATRFRPELVEKRPGIFIKRDRWWGERIAIGDSAGVDVRDGHETYQVHIVGSHTIFAVSAATDGGEAEVLGAEVFRFLLHYAPLLWQELNFLTCGPPQEGALGKLQESQDHYAVPITLPYRFEESWQLQQHAPRLKRIGLSLSSLVD